MKTWFTWIILVAIPLQLSGQCFSGSIGTTGPGCGCLNSCNLTTLGGPDCTQNPVTGSCPSQLSSITFFIPPACEIRIDAQMQPRNSLGCTASGADLNDALKVEGAIAKSFVPGAGNAAITDTHTQTGGEITVYCIANRADEIVTYQAYVVSGICPECSLLLPVEFAGFNAFSSDGEIFLEWLTASEINNDYFSVEYSPTQDHWIEVLQIPGAGNSSSLLHYAVSVPAPQPGITYWRIRQTDYNGEFSFSPVIGIQSISNQPVLSFHPGSRIFSLLFDAMPGEYTLRIYSITGEMTMNKKTHFETSAGQFDFELPAGLFVIALINASGELIWSSKISSGGL